MAKSLFPSTLTRKQYSIRCLVVLIILVATFILFVAVPSNLAQLAAALLVLVSFLTFVYVAFVLSIPRLKNAKLTPVWTVIAFIPFGILVLFLICVIAPEKSMSPPVSQADFAEGA